MEMIYKTLEDGTVIREFRGKEILLETQSRTFEISADPLESFKLELAEKGLIAEIDPDCGCGEEKGL